MKITYISESIIPSRSANSIHVMKMCQAFAKLGHDVLLIIPNKENTETADIKESVYDFYGVEECFKIAKIPWLKVKGGKRLFGLLSSIKAKLFSADLIYGRSLLGCYYSTFFGVPVFFESHHPVNKDTSGVIFNKLLKHKKCVGLVVISTALKQYYLTNYNIDSNIINVVPDAADPVHCSDNNYATSSERLRVGYVGQLYPGKGMEIIAELAKKCPWADFHIVGGVEEDIVKWKNELRGSKNVIFHGFIPHGKIKEYLCSFDVLLAPYQKKVKGHGGGNTDIGQWMSPLKLFEYMAAGKPMICSDLPVLREVLKHGETALLVSPVDIDSWVKAMKKLEQDRQYARKLGQNARNEFFEKYTWEARAKRLISLFQKQL